MNGLAKQLEELNKELSTQIPEEVFNVFRKSIEDLKSKNLEAQSIQVGERFPEFSLPNIFNKTIHSKEVLKYSKMILVFFRGSWCPYCNLELKYLQANLDKIKAKNAILLAVSPQAVSNSQTLAENIQLGFEILTDYHNELAKKLGITFVLQDFVLPYYRDLGIDLSEFNKNIENILPVPAAFIIDEKGILVFKFFDVNYMNRVNIDELLNEL